jgi:hypothetical protein
MLHRLPPPLDLQMSVGDGCTGDRRDRTPQHHRGEKRADRGKASTAGRDGCA